jgi:hypothetical protein
MFPDLLQAFQSLPQPERRQRLLDEGYVRIHDSSGVCTVYHKPDTNIVLRFSMRPEMTALTNKYLTENQDNPFLPRVYAHSAIEGGKHVTVMEKLISTQDLNDDFGIDLLGQTRAIATFPFGDKIHGAAHRGLAGEDGFLKAVRILATCARESFKNPSSKNECLFLDRNPGGVMYRMGADGMPFPVLVDTLTYTAPSKQLEDQLERIFARLQRFEAAERKRTLTISRKGSPEPA